MIRLNEIVFPQMYSLLYDGPLTDSTVDALADQRIKSIHKEDAETQPTKKLFAFKAVDDSTGEIVGESRWVIHFEDEVLTKTVEDEVEERINPPMPQLRVQPMAEFGRMLAIAKREVLAVPSESGQTAEPNASIKLPKMVYLHVLAVHPNHQKKGIGRRLLQWGLDEADRLGLISYLESSMDGVRLYQSSGFEKVKDISMNLRPFGGNSDLNLRVSFFIV